MTHHLFILLCITMFGLACYMIKSSYQHYKYLIVALFTWLTLTAWLAKSSFLMNFNTLPPRIFIVIFPMVPLITYVSTSKKIESLTSSISQSILIYSQTFRIIVEYILHSLAAQQIIPELMTWNGRNFDIFIGLSAPIVGYFYCNKHVLSATFLTLWNYLGLLFLGNVFIHGLLSGPTPFQVFVTDPLNVFVATFPYVWLPGFLVPLAISCHILSLRKLSLEKNQS